MQRWLRRVPLVAWVAAAAIPLWQYGRRAGAEAAGEAFLRHLADAQLEFRRRDGAHFAAALESLTTPCPGAARAALDAAAVRSIGERGFVVFVRPVTGVSGAGVDCHGRPGVSDYYAALQPVSASAAPRQ